MHYLILTKRKIMIFSLCFVLGLFTLLVSFNGISSVVSASNTEKKIPIYCVDKKEKKISISFDAAWGNEQTQELLDILSQYNVKTTFFLVGSWVDKYPESVKAISDAGHDVGNHSNTHPHMTKLSKEKEKEEISLCNEKIYKITNKKPTLFRPPYGDYNNSVVESVRELGMHCIQWDVDSLDWKDPTSEEMLKKVTESIKPGSIVLFHNGAKNTPKTLPKTIEAIKNQGYEIVPISELILQGEYKTDHEGKQILCN